MSYFRSSKASEEGSLEDSAAQERQTTLPNASSLLGIGGRQPFVGQPSAHLSWQRDYWDRKTSRMLGDPW